MKAIRVSPKRVSRSRTGTFLIVVFLALLSLIMILPLVYTLLQAFKPIEEIFIFPPKFWVQHPTLNNITMIFSLTTNLRVPFSRYLFNSVFITGLCTALQVIFASMAAYPLSKHRFPGQKAIFSLIVLSLLFTYDVTFLPQYIMISKMHLVNSYWALILPSLSFPLGLYLMRQNLQSFPDSVLESARIDGASEAVIFWRVVMPSVKAVWLTMVIFSFGALWNRSDTAFVYSEELKSLPTLLSQLASGGIARAGVSAATSLLLIIPPLLVFILTQSGVTETMANSGLKE